MTFPGCFNWLFVVRNAVEISFKTRLIGRVFTIRFDDVCKCSFVRDNETARASHKQKGSCEAPINGHDTNEQKVFLNPTQTARTRRMITATQNNSAPDTAIVNPTGYLVPHAFQCRHKTLAGHQRQTPQLLR